MKDFPINRTFHFVTECLTGQGIGKNRDVSLTQQHINTLRVITVLVANENGIQLLWNDIQRIHPHDELLGTKTCIYKNTSGTTPDKSGIAFTATSQNSNAYTSANHKPECGRRGLLLQGCSDIGGKHLQCDVLIFEKRLDLVKRQILAQIAPMNITQILLGSTAAILIAALILSYSAMKGGEAEDGRRHSAKELMQDNARLQAEILRLRSGRGMAGGNFQVEMPKSMSVEQLSELEEQNQLLKEQIEAEKKKREQAEAETVAMTERQSGKLNREQRRAKLIGMAMLMAQVKEVAQEGGIYVVVIDVKMHEQVPVGSELAIRRGTGIIGRLTVSSIDGGGNCFADPLPGSFPGGNIDVKVGDELIVPPL